jgi:hypothetical protein
MRTHREKNNNNSYTPTPEATEQYKHTPKKRKTKVSETSKKAWREINEEGIPLTQKLVVLAELSKIQPATSRKMTDHTKFERSSITRSFNDLVEEGKAKIVFVTKCPHSGRSVQWYGLPDWINSENQEGML